ncbi:DUF4397 domain-containing protein [Paenibacillus daejeonensis]|uniref:DUF4397 domain-containing protein n=1 Tax=Paenibacillus daejeonensis TaxID=135193 RepID=UPI0003AB08E2|nr:DUF4397 domain-containing protein [Paenibacillus daejeonensis]
MDRLAEQVELQGTAWDERDQHREQVSYGAQAPIYNQPLASNSVPPPPGIRQPYQGSLYPGLSSPGYGSPGAPAADSGYNAQAYPGFGQQASSAHGGRPAGFYGQPAPFGLQGNSTLQWPSGSLPIRMEPMSSRLRIVHASPAGPPVDVFLNQKLAAADVSYKDVVPYLNVQAGNYLIEVYPAGKTGEPLLSRTLNVQSGQSYTLAAGNIPSELQLYAYLDDPAPTAGQARLRVFHLSPAAEAVDVRTGAGTILFGNVAFGQSTAYATIPPGTVDLQSLVSGTEQIILALPERELAADSVTTVVALGLTEGEPPLEALLLTDL